MSIAPQSPASSAGGAPPLLEVHALRKYFAATCALDDVSLAFYSGEIHCVLGENGAGKSTLGKIIGGVYSKDQGDVLVDGKVVQIGSVTGARRLGIAVVFQELSLAPDLSVRANLLLGIEPRRHPFSRLRHGDERARVRAVLDKLQLDIDVDRRVLQLPVATQQMIEVAKALIREPRMIVLDEPTAMLGALDKRRLFDVLAQLRRDGTAFAFITHHIEDVDALADRVSILRNGRLVDSFKVEGRCDPDAVLEKLSGKPVAHRPAQAHRVDHNPFVRIDGLRDRAGKAATLELARGEIVALYGVVGCGAEEVARVLVGLGHSSKLSATLDGAPLAPRDPAQASRTGIAYLPSGRARNGILPTRSIRENLNVSLLHRYARAGVVSRRRECAGTRAQLTTAAVKFADAENNITVLSGGNQQKLLMARTLASARNVMVLEDPTAGIDIGAKREIQDAVRTRANEGVAVVLISSDLIEAIEMADTLYTMYAGAVVRRYPSPQLDDQSAIVADVIGQDRNPLLSSGMPAGIPVVGEMQRLIS
jgi:ribose transport system ATP-binding protein